MAKGDGAGRPTDMTDEILAIIKEGIVDGKPMREMAQISGIPESTLYDWTYKNYGNFADKLENWKLQAKLKKAESRADEILSLPLHDKDNKIDSSVLNTVQKESQFIRETLAKDRYSKRSEQTGADGSALQIQVINYAGNTPLQVQPETIPDAVSAGMGLRTDEIGQSSSSSEWEGFDSNGESTQENAGA